MVFASFLLNTTNIVLWITEQHDIVISDKNNLLEYISEISDFVPETFKLIHYLGKKLYNDIKYRIFIHLFIYSLIHLLITISLHQLIHITLSKVNRSYPNG